MTQLEHDAFEMMIADLVSPWDTPAEPLAHADRIRLVARRVKVGELIVSALRNDADLLAAIARVRPWCQVCGCTDEFACEDGCDWVEPGLCSTHSPA